MEKDTPKPEETKLTAGEDDQAKDRGRAGRIIIRNIGFDIREQHLRSFLAKHGSILDVNVPMKSDKPNINRGFAFVELGSKEEAEKAVKELNGTNWKGRTVTVDLSVPKGKYESRIESVVEHTKLDRTQAVLPKVLRQEKEAKQAELDKKKQAEDEYKLKNAAKIKKQEKKKAKKLEQKKQAEQANLSETLFVRNIGYETNQDRFREFMEKFGPVHYAVLCKSNNEGDASAHKGTGFVQFKSQEIAD